MHSIINIFENLLNITLFSKMCCDLPQQKNAVLERCTSMCTLEDLWMPLHLTKVQTHSGLWWPSAPSLFSTVEFYNTHISVTTKLLKSILWLFAQSPCISPKWAFFFFLFSFFFTMYSSFFFTTISFFLQNRQNKNINFKPQFRHLARLLCTQWCII